MIDAKINSFQHHLELTLLPIWPNIRTRLAGKSSTKESLNEFPMNYLATRLCSIVGGGDQIAKFEEKTLKFISLF